MSTQTSTYIYGGFGVCLFGGYDCFLNFLDHAMPFHHYFCLSYTPLLYPLGQKYSSNSYFLGPHFDSMNLIQPHFIPEG